MRADDTRLVTVSWHVVYYGRCHSTPLSFKYQRPCSLSRGSGLDNYTLIPVAHSSHSLVTTQTLRTSSRSSLVDPFFPRFLIDKLIVQNGYTTDQRPD